MHLLHAMIRFGLRIATVLGIALALKIGGTSRFQGVIKGII